MCVCTYICASVCLCLHACVYDLCTFVCVCVSIPQTWLLECKGCLSTLGSPTLCPHHRYRHVHTTEVLVSVVLCVAMDSGTSL